MKLIFSFLKPYKIPITVAYALTFIELIVELLLPFFLGKMINDGVVNQNFDNIVMWGSIMIGMAFIAFIAGIFNSFYASHVSFGFAYDIREKMFNKIQRFSFANLNQYPTSGLVTRFTNDVRQIQNTIFMALRIMAKAPLIVIGGVVMAFIVNAKLALIFLVTVPVLVGFILWVLKIATNLFDKVQRRVDQVNRVMQENLAGMRLIKAFLRRDHEENRFTRANKNLATTTKSTFRLVESSMPVLLFIMNLSLIFILWFGNIQSVSNQVAVGDVVAIVNYALRIAMAISMFTFLTMAFSRMKASLKRLSEVLAVDIDLLDHQNADQKLAITNGKIEFKNVSFSYPKSSSKILKDISFTIEPRETIAIIGEIGRGKTTLFQLIPRLYDVNKGKILIDNQVNTAYSLENLRGKIGYVPQSP